MKIEPTKLAGVLVLTPNVHRDHRGYFYEGHRASDLPGVTFVQSNIASRLPQSLVGLHYQVKDPQGKLVRVISGAVHAAAVNLIKDHPEFGKSVIQALDSNDCKALYVPPGFGFGFMALNTGAIVQYECTSYYVEANARSIRWNDPELNIPWPLSVQPFSPAIQPTLSGRDLGAPYLKDAELPQLNGPVDFDRARAQ